MAASRRSSAAEDVTPSGPTPWEELRRASVQRFGSLAVLPSHAPAVPPLDLSVRIPTEGELPTGEEENDLLGA